ncbi:GNAT family N-acetyltransferase [Streptomyces sp. R44]|uniref:GNAT family N-acetyltransferase n=1 Tax=Streptomyces sp. R44 TaxID=3238633 RepID=A0AB39TFU0_9ACTN
MRRPLRPAPHGDPDGGGGPCGPRLTTPGCRGHGLAARLIASVETWAHDTGAGAIRLSVPAADAPAIALYERLGYAPDGRAGQERVMTKRLPPAS